MLESVCLQAFAQDPELACTEDYLKCLPTKNAESPTLLQKARLQVLLASKDAPLRLEIAVKQSWWPWEHEAFDEVKAFLHQIAAT
jgi:hypothetical protein